MAMSELRGSSLAEYFGDMPDPRVVGRCDHKLLDIILIAICAVLSGAESWNGVEEFGRAKREWLQQFLELPQGIPSHDTFRRVFSLLDARVFQKRFVAWAEQTFGVKREQVIAVDSSLPPDAARLLAAVRTHWQIENNLHWVLDVIFHEDDSRLHVGNGAENFAVLRRVVLNLLKSHPAKISLKRKRYRAALDDSFLLELLTQV